MGIERYVTALIEGRKHSSISLFFLYLFSKVFEWGIKLRHVAYKIHFFKTGQVNAPVISVGNITAGGTGKTPLINHLVQLFLREGKVAIISRGYRSSLECQTTPTAICLGQGPLFSSLICGDEPYLLASFNPTCDLWIGKNRLLAAKMAIQRGVDFIFLDDGMQSLELKRDLEIVVMDGKELFGKGYFLPRGYLREDPKELKKASYIFVNHIQCATEYREAKCQLLPYTQAPVIGIRMHLAERLSGVKAGVFCGLGKPQRFLDTLNEAGVSIIDALIAGDHKSFTVDALEIFAEQCKAKGAEMLLCTEKDAVKLANQVKFSLPIKSVKVSLEVVEGKEHWDALYAKIKSLRES